MRLIIIFCMVLLFSTATSHAVEKGARISDREIIEALAEIKAGQARLESKVVDGFKSINQRLEDGLKATNQRIDSLGQRVDDLRDLIYIILGGIIGLIGFVLWDRRSALAPAIRKSKELEEREELLEKVIKEYARKEPRLAEVLKSVGLT